MLASRPWTPQAQSREAPVDRTIPNALNCQLLEGDRVRAGTRRAFLWVEACPGSAQSKDRFRPYRKKGEASQVDLVEGE